VPVTSLPYRIPESEARPTYLSMSKSKLVIKHLRNKQSKIIILAKLSNFLSHIFLLLSRNEKHKDKQKYTVSISIKKKRNKQILQLLIDTNKREFKMMKKKF